jgi:hypothetical protein
LISVLAIFSSVTLEVYKLRKPLAISHLLRLHGTRTCIELHPDKQIIESIVGWMREVQPLQQGCGQTLPPESARARNSSRGEVDPYCLRGASQVSCCILQGCITDKSPNAPTKYSRYSRPVTTIYGIPHKLPSAKHKHNDCTVMNRIQ